MGNPVELPIGQYPERLLLKWEFIKRKILRKNLKKESKHAFDPEKRKVLRSYLFSFIKSDAGSLEIVAVDVFSVCLIIYLPRD